MSKVHKTPQEKSDRKRNLSSPNEQLDPKKTKPETSSPSAMPSIEEDINPEVDGNVATARITLDESDLEKISKLLEDSFQNTFESRIAVLVANVVEQVMGHVNDKVSSLIEENAALKARVATLELKSDASEQYSRRNLLRISGIPEDPSEDTDEKVLGIAKSLGATISLEDIDRSHRSGTRKTFASAAASKGPVKPRDILVKFSTYRARQKLFTLKSKLKTTGYSGVFLNEDLTHVRKGIFFEARKLKKAKYINSVWSHDGLIIIKDNNLKTHRVETVEALSKLRHELGVPN